MISSPISLTGFMGVGKSAVGKELAQLLDFEFLDTDSIISRAKGASVKDIFRYEGEEKFRHYEFEAIAGAVTVKNAVISLGGGALSYAPSADIIFNNTFVIYLRASLETLMTRINPNERPLLNGLEGAELLDRIGRLLSSRESVYKQANISIDTDGYSVQEVTQRIYDRLKMESI